MNKTVNMQVKVLKALLNDKSVTAIYHAGDADREGEVIVRNVLQALLKSQNRYTVSGSMLIHPKRCKRR